MGQLPVGQEMIDKIIIVTHKRVWYTVWVCQSTFDDVNQSYWRSFCGNVVNNTSSLNRKRWEEFNHTSLTIQLYVRVKWIYQENNWIRQEKNTLVGTCATMQGTLQESEKGIDCHGSRMKEEIEVEHTGGIRCRYIQPVRYWRRLSLFLGAMDKEKLKKCAIRCECCHWKN